MISTTKAPESEIKSLVPKLPMSESPERPARLDVRRQPIRIACRSLLNHYWYGVTNMASILRLSYEISVQDRYLVGVQIFEVPKTEAYPFGYRYRLFCMDPVTGGKVLMDTHHPKGPHVHINNREHGYTFSTPEKLVSDFKEMVLQRMGIVL